jgi:CBS domain-containing protein
MRIQDAYRPETITVGADESLMTAAYLLTDEQVGALAVIGAERIGIISERDIVHAVANGVDLLTERVRSYASFDVYTAELDDDPSDVAYQMLQSGIRHRPVIQHNRFIGMVSMRDVLALETPVS